jgi:hypothetical protein
MSAPTNISIDARTLHNPRVQGFLTLLVLVLVAGLSVAQQFPQGATPANASPDLFSSERAMAHLPAIASEPHPAGSKAQEKVRDYLFTQLSALGLEVETQPFVSGENVVARLRGGDSTGAIVILAHYDSTPAGPGAADNGAGAAALLEVLRALVAGPLPRNDVIALFDDNEEQGWIGTRAFIQEHPWIADVSVAVSLDTAARGVVHVNETGPRNGKLVQALARAYRHGWAWMSAAGGGSYDSGPFIKSGFQALSLEDNYAFKEQHTENDRIEIISPASLQQLGEQALAVARELGDLKLSDPWGQHQAFFAVPLIGLVHYPQAWTLPLALAAAVLLLAAIAFALHRGVAGWRGLLVGLAAIIVAALLAAVLVSALWSQVPKLLSWNTSAWPEWPEIIPPNGGLILAVFALLAMALAISAYWLSRRVSRRADLALSGLVPFAILALFFASSEPRLAIIPVWPVLIGAIGWLFSLAVFKHTAWTADLPAFLAAIVLWLVIPALIFGTFFGSGLNEAAILAAMLTLFILVELPAVESALRRLRGEVQPAGTKTK